ncbi:hypothetical protein E2562_038484 [Oryza meyeriana var. granulata]|uniref:Disease resistance protein At4g27190-like leucine-rich repeats domain-containing protein n=1 Tax=Oryza meyeriana var. granulata TaxID=110450 RepID=A0A6G1C333_9ORYZ|nr:hypothetical protein E2562_038484 [Oryza meyeriana var. granulata]
MPREWFNADTIEEAVQEIIPYLERENTSRAAHKAIYFDGWGGLAASAVLRAIAENPGPSLTKKFDKIIHVDCSRWKSRRALQRAIADELELPQHVMNLFDRQDEEDDFSGVNESSRAEITDFSWEIYKAIKVLSCLLICHNGSDGTVDIASFGFPLNDWFPNRMLWTFGGRLRLNPKIREKVDSSHLKFDTRYESSAYNRNALLAREATEITRCSRELLHLDVNKATDCCLYLLSLNCRGGDSVDYNWTTHACNYWVCDGIITVQEEEEEEEGRLQEERAWEVAAALHQEIRLEDYSSNTVPWFGYALDTPQNRWIVVTQEESNMKNKPTPQTTSLFVAFQSVALLPNDMFHQANNLRVLRLCNCAFSFSSPPFHCCHNLRFLGLNKCQDHRPQEDGEDKRNASLALGIFQRLWVLDVCYTDWELVFPTESSTNEHQLAIDIREVYINKGRIWCSNFAWRRLKNLRKLRVIEPTHHPWGMDGKMDEFADMLKLELLDLSKNNMIQVLPSLSRAGNLKTLILDGCVGLKQVGPHGLPPSLESFSFDSRVGGTAKISSISLAGCSSLVSCTLHGPLPNLKDLDISGTIVKMFDLRDLQAQCLERISLLRCEKLRAILWPEEGFPKLSLLRIDSFACHVEMEHQKAYATLMDVRFVQSLVLTSSNNFCWNCDKIHLNICIPSTPKDTTLKNETMDPYSTQKVVGSPLHRSIITMTQPVCYKDVNLGMISTIGPHASNAPQLEPLDLHVEIGEGISYVNLVSEQVLSAVAFVMDKVNSLHVHDNFSITSVNPKHVMLEKERGITWYFLKWCCIQRCHKLDTVFAPDYTYYCFPALEAFLAAELMMASYIWSRGPTSAYINKLTFRRLRSIHLHSCPRLLFVLPLSWCTPYSHLPSLETLHIVCCGELRQIFPVEPVALGEKSAELPRGVLEFPKLKHIHLHDLPQLQQICDVSRMFAPELETIMVRGCWSLKRIPATTDRRRQDSRPVVDCEKDWWEKLEWDGLNARHHHSLYELRQLSSYYRKALARGSLLR